MNTLLQHRWLISLAILINLCLLDHSLFAQGVNESSPEIKNGVIVLKDGGVFSGDITNVAGGYRVDSNGTYAVVPFAKVDVTSANMNEAYIALRDRVLKPTATDHLQLAEWCLKNKLVGQARSEVAGALTLEPLRPDARILMEKIDDLLNPQKETIKLPSQTAMTIDGFLREEQQNSGGINRQLHQDFIRQIQPLLMNKCGNAYCHGEAARNDFRLEHIQRGSSGNRLQSQHNLEQVLKYIDHETPAKSKLLLGDSSNNSAHAKVFLGSTGNLQYKSISDWVVGMTGKPLQATPPRTSLAVTASPEDREIQLLNGKTVQAEPSSILEEKMVLETTRSQSRPDPFDPEIFNRQVHGLTARQLREQGGDSKPTTEKE